MVFGGRRNMAITAAAVKGKVKVVNRKKYIREEDLSECAENHYDGSGMFSEDPEFSMWLEEPDPIVIDFEDEFRHASTKAPCTFREISKSFGGQGLPPPHYQQLEHLPIPWPNPYRRFGSESCLALASAMHTLPMSAGCPCEAVQGVHTRKTCHKMEMAIPDTCCFTCGSDWSLEHTALACFECGGYAAVRPCLACDGKCGEIWHRDLKLTHVTGVANWCVGKCRLEETNKSSISASDSLTRDSTSKVVPLRA